MTAPAPIALGSEQFWSMLALQPEALASQIASIDAVSLQRTLEQHASLRAWISAAFESAKIAESYADLEYDTAHARAMLVAREEDDARTKKPKTVEVLKAEVQLHPEVLARAKTVIQAQQKVGALRAINESLEHRKDMLVQISSNQRKESGAYNAKP